MDKFRPPEENHGNHQVPELDQAIHKFYESDTVSRQLPGRRAFATIKKDGEKIRLQKKSCCPL